MPQGWNARLELSFARTPTRTILERVRHEGPYVVQRPFWEPSGVCQVYILHPPGGVVGGDGLTLQVRSKEATSALLTTPAATKLYRSNGLQARLEQKFDVEEQASLEWLPQETILFDGAWASSTTKVSLSTSARFAGWEVICLGRPAAGESFERGLFEQSVEVWQDGKPVWLERCHIEGGDEILRAPWGLGGRTVLGTFVCSGVQARVTSTLVEQVFADHGLFSVSQIQDLVVCRYLGSQAQEARRVFAAAWSRLRPETLKTAATAPRIWAT